MARSTLGFLVVNLPAVLVCFAVGIPWYAWLGIWGWVAAAPFMLCASLGWAYLADHLLRLPRESK